MTKGDAAAHEAQIHLERTVQRGEITEEDIVSVEAPKENTTIYAYLTSEAIKSNNAEVGSNANVSRMITQGGVELNGEKITNPQQEVSFRDGDMIKFGKRNYFKIQKND